MQTKVNYLKNIKQDCGLNIGIVIILLCYGKMKDIIFKDVKLYCGLHGGVTNSSEINVSNAKDIIRTEKK